MIRRICQSWLPKRKLQQYTIEALESFENKDLLSFCNKIHFNTRFLPPRTKKDMFIKKA